MATSQYLNATLEEDTRMREPRGKRSFQVFPRRVKSLLVEEGVKFQRIEECVSCAKVQRDESIETFRKLGWVSALKHRILGRSIAKDGNREVGRG